MSLKALHVIAKACRTAEQRRRLASLLQRYGVRSGRLADLLPAQVGPFTVELEAVLKPKAPHPDQSNYVPSARKFSL